LNKIYGTKFPECASFNSFSDHKPSGGVKLVFQKNLVYSKQFLKHL